MHGRSRLSLLVPGLSLLLLVGCARLPEERVEHRAAGTAGTVPVAVLEDSVSVPSDWGDLVAVTHHETYPAAYLWLQADDGTIRMVTYDYNRAVFWPRAVVLRRR